MSMHPRSTEATRKYMAPYSNFDWRELCEALAIEIPKPRRRKPPGTPTPTEQLKAIIHDAGVERPNALMVLRMYRDTGLWVKGDGDTFQWCDANSLTYQMARLAGASYESFTSQTPAEREALIEQERDRRLQEQRQRLRDKVAILSQQMVRSDQ